MSIGIYQIIHKESGRFYLGSSQNIEKRWTQHRNDLKMKRHHCIFLQRAWDLYGPNAFEFKILEITDNLLEREQELLDQYQESLFNTSKQASGGDLISYHPNKEAIITKMATSMKDRMESLTPEERKQIYGRSGELNGNFDNRWSDEQRLKASLKHRGLTHTEEAKAKMSQSLKAIWTPEMRASKRESVTGAGNPFYGKVHTEETKQKIREANIGKKSINSRPISIDGTIYESLTEASRHLNVVVGTIHHRLHSKNPKYSNYFYVDQQNLARDCLEESSPV